MEAKVEGVAVEGEINDGGDNVGEELDLGDQPSITEHSRRPCEMDHSPKQTLVVVISSDDRLEVTLTPGAVETILEIVKVSVSI